jgi:hypothetical protein
VLLLGLWPSPTLAQNLALDQDFTTDPTAQGWAVAGDSSLFQWLPEAGALAVTWDSSQPNSFFHLPLRTCLTREDDFAFAFDLRLDDAAIGTTAGKQWSFEIALGFLNLPRATAPGFYRGTGADSPDLVEWDYFPASPSIAATVAASITSSANAWAADGFTWPHPLELGVTYRFRLEYRAATRTLSILETANGVPTALTPAHLTADFDDFAVDAFAVSSYSDAGQDPIFGGSVLAHGTVDNVRLELPAPPIRRFAGVRDDRAWSGQFTGWIGWDYTLESSTDLTRWSPVAAPVPGTGLRQSLIDPTPPPHHAFYRLRATLR